MQHQKRHYEDESIARKEIIDNLENYLQQVQIVNNCLFLRSESLLLSKDILGNVFYLTKNENRIDVEVYRQKNGKTFNNSHDSYNSNDGLCLEKVEDDDMRKEVEKHRKKLLMKLEETIRERVKIGRIARNEWKKSNVSQHLKVNVIEIGQLLKIARKTKDID